MVNGGRWSLLKTVRPGLAWGPKLSEACFLGKETLIHAQVPMHSMSAQEQCRQTTNGAECNNFDNKHGSTHTVNSKYRCKISCLLIVIETT